MLKVTYGVCGRFHAFSLAANVEKLGFLEQVFSADRSWRPPSGIPYHKFNNRLDLAARQRVGRYVPMLQAKNGEIEAEFDRWLLGKVRRLKPGVLHGWNLHVRRTFQGLQGEGWKLCLERSCPHNAFQDQLLKDEAARLGLSYSSDPRTLDEAIQELYLADVISAPSQYSARSYDDPALVAKLRINPLGCNYQLQAPFTRTRQPLRVLMVGNEFLRKGTHYLIEAFRLIKEPNAELKIRGNIPREYESRINDPRIQVVPPVTRSALDGLYRWANVFCLPSIDDGFGLVALEALSYGLPLIITENVGAADVLSSSVARVVPIRDYRAIESAIRWASDLDPDYVWQEAATILKNNSWALAAQRQIDKVYQLSSS
jgi:glycosyltransferase involved in cell wall biosynthesis